MFPENPPRRPDSPVDAKRGILVACAAMGVTAAALIVKWFLTTIFGSAGVLVLLLAAAAIGTYLWLRRRDPQKVRAMEARVRQSARAAVTQMSTPNRGYPPPSPPAPTYPMTPHVAPQSTPTSSSDGLVSALLLLPSLLAFGLVYSPTSFSSVWQPWWILNGLNLFFLICVVARARSPHRRTAALLPGLAGLVIVGLATSPSPDVNLRAIFSTRQGYGSYTYVAPPEDLLPWLVRAPYLAILLFVIAWGLARREGGWGVGLIPASLLLWWSIWYRENEFTGEAGWFGVWGLTVGVFIGGCLACWALDAMTRPRTAQPPVAHWPT